MKIDENASCIHNMEILEDRCEVQELHIKNLKKDIQNLNDNDYYLRLDIDGLWKGIISIWAAIVLQTVALAVLAFQVFTK